MLTKSRLALGQLRHVCRDPPRLVFTEQLGCRGVAPALPHNKRRQASARGAVDHDKGGANSSTDQGGGKWRAINFDSDQCGRTASIKLEAALSWKLGAGYEPG